MRFEQDPRLTKTTTVARAMRLLVVAASLSLAACATSDAQRDSSDSDAVRAHDREVCAGYGFTIGAEDFAHCVQALQDQRRRSTR